MNYEILEEIGRGAMGKVYRARDLTLGREIAVKVLPEELSRDIERLTRFKSEARSLASLNHPNIVQIYSVEEENGIQFITMELIHGKTIAEVPVDGRKLTTFLDFAVTLTDAIASAHDKGITHRDLKPANIMITEEGRVKILDFGLAKVSRAEPPLGVSKLETVSSPTVEGTIVGTLAYMSPEQAEGKSVDHRSDIFSVGVICYELLAGKLPFDGDSAAAMLSSTIKDEPRSLSEVRPDVPRELARVVHRCLVKDPERRYQSIKDVRNELEARDAWTRSDPSHVAPATRSRRHAPLVTAVLLSALFGGSSAWMVLRRSESPSVTRWTLSLPPGQRLVMGILSTPFDISPDGRYIAYVATDGDDDDPSRAHAFLRPLDAFEATPIPASAGTRVVFFSSDSRHLAFHTVDGGLWRTSVSGGAPLKIGNTVPLVSGAWADDTIVFASRSVPPKLWKISAGGGEPEELPAPEGHDAHSAPQFLPGGRHLLTNAFDEQGSSIEILSVDGTEHREVVKRGFAAKARYLRNGQLLIVEGGSLLTAPMDPDRPEAVGQLATVLEGVQGPFETVAVSDTGTLVYMPAVPSTARIVQIERDDGTETSWTISGLSTMNPIRISPDGGRLAVNLEGATGLKRDVAVYDLSRGTLTQLSRTGQSRVPIWSPDGQHVAFQSNRDDADGIFVIAADGTGDARPVLLREARQSRVPPRVWTPDGESIVYLEPAEGGADFWMVSRDGGEPTPLLQTPFDEGRLDFSPDGRFFTFHSNESGQYQIYVQEFPDGRKWPATKNGGMWPDWVGKEIFYRRGNTIMVVEVETEPFDASTATALFQRPDIRSYDVSPDGRRFFVMEEPRPPRTEIHVIQNWFQELESAVVADR